MEDISALRLFLDYGAIGLAGLMLVLVALSLRGEIGTRKERLLKMFMVIAFASFSLALAAEFFATSSRHRLVLDVVPTDFDEHPAPIVRLNGNQLDRDDEIYVESDSSLLVNVSAAITELRSALDAAETARAEVIRQQVVLDQTEARVATLLDGYSRVFETFSTQAPSTAALTDLGEVRQELRLLEFEIQR